MNMITFTKDLVACLKLRVHLRGAWRNVASNIVLIKFFGFSINLWVAIQLVRYDASLDADTPNLSLMLGVHGP